MKKDESFYGEECGGGAPKFFVQSGVCELSQHCSRIRCPLFLKFFVYLLALFLSFFSRSHKIFLEKDKKRTLIIALNGKQIPPPSFCVLPLKGGSRVSRLGIDGFPDCLMVICPIKSITMKNA